MMSKALQSLRESLFASGFVQPLDSTGRGGSISILCRLLPNQEKGWIQTVDKLLTVADELGIQLHVCRKYLRKDGRMVSGWHIGVEANNAKDLADQAEKLSEVLKKAQESLPEVQEQPAAPEPAPARSTNVPRPYQRGPRIQPIPGTDAPRRLPEYSGPDPVPPAGHAPVLKRVPSEQGEVFEMPIPHVFQEGNIPKAGSNKGAASMLKNSELYKGLNLKKGG